MKIKNLAKQLFSKENIAIVKNYIWPEINNLFYCFLKCSKAAFMRPGPRKKSVILPRNPVNSNTPVISNFQFVQAGLLWNPYAFRDVCMIPSYFPI